VKVLDFGISKLSDGGTMQTTDSVLMGTPLYMSPEQALGHNRDVTQQSDVFSLGSIAYECLAGKAPFQADNIAQVVFRIAYEPHKPLLSVAPNVPEAMAKAVEHALQKDLAARTPSVAAFVLELTGQVLSNAGSPKAAGPSNVLKPGEQVDEAMMAEATAAPSSKVQPKLLMTPNPPSAREPVAPPRSNPPAGRSPLLLIGGAVGVLAIGIGAYLAATGIGTTVTGSPDASVTATPTVDAGSAEVAFPTSAVDAGQLPAATPVVDAGTPETKPVDAGVVVAPIKTPLPPPSPEDALLISEFEAETKANPETAWARRASMQVKMQSPGGKRVLLTMLVEMACQRADLTNAQAYSRQLSGSAKDLARKRCRKHQPAWELD